MPPIRVLNVAEKPSVAKEVSRVLSNGRASMREGQTPWNKIWEFEHRVQGQQCRMVFTSVTGHLMNLDFTGAARKWGGINARELIDGAPVEKMVSSGKEKTAENLRREARNAAWLILWLDCDREGENIAFEVMDVCRGVKPTLRILRARFSALSHNDVTRALNALVAPNENESKAVDMRQELDLRLGASFTRFNTMLLQNRFRLPGANEDGRGAVVSYGPCQFPTLGFIVQRKWDQDAHVPERFWKIRLTHRPGAAADGSGGGGGGGRVRGGGGGGGAGAVNPDAGAAAEFAWARERLFDEGLARTLFGFVQTARIATVTNEGGRETKKWPPVPLNTIEMQKRVNRACRISPAEVMKVAEELYNAGFISYPRTETDAFPKDFDFAGIIGPLTNHHVFGFHARALSAPSNRFRFPGNGGHDDNAHPPIYPTKLATERDYDAWRRDGKMNQIKIYDFVARHFLATCSLPAIAHKTTVEIEIGGEAFKATGVMIKEMNYLDVYGKGPVGGPRFDVSYDGWANNTLPTYAVGQRFEPTELSLAPGATQPPQLLSETDLLQKMENHQIGTDATQAQHIEKVVGERGYAVKVGDNRLRPTELGEALCAGYYRMGLEDMWLPTKRAVMEADVNRVALGQLDVPTGKRNTTTPMLDAFRDLERKQRMLVDAVAEFVFPNENHRGGGPGADGGGGGVGVGTGPGVDENLGAVRACAACGAPVELRKSPRGRGPGGGASFSVSCSGVGCDRADSNFALPDAVTSAAIDVMHECEDPACVDVNGGAACLVDLRMRMTRLPPRFAHMGQFTGCLFCDRELRDLISMMEEAPRGGGGGGGGPPGAGPGMGAGPGVGPGAGPGSGGGGGGGGRGRGRGRASSTTTAAAGGRGRGRGRASSTTTAGRGRGRTRAADGGGNARNVRARGGGGGGGGGDCFKCGRPGHWASNCPNE